MTRPGRRVCIAAACNLVIVSSRIIYGRRLRRRWSQSLHHRSLAGMRDVRSSLVTEMFPSFGFAPGLPAFPS